MHPVPDGVLIQEAILLQGCPEHPEALEEMNDSTAVLDDSIVATPPAKYKREQFARCSGSEASDGGNSPECAKTLQKTEQSQQGENKCSSHSPLKGTAKHSGSEAADGGNSSEGAKTAQKIEKGVPSSRNKA